MLTQPKNNYTETLQRISSCLQASPLITAIVKPKPLEFLNPEGSTFSSVEFRRAGTVCYLEVSVDPDGWPVTGADGHEWQKHTLSCKVNWASGPTEPAVALARVSLYHAVCVLALEIQAEITCDIWSLSATSSQVAARKTKEQQDFVACRAREVVMTHRKGLRVGKDVVLNSAAVKGIPPGTYKVLVDEYTGNMRWDGRLEKKQFELVVHSAETSGIVATVTRVA